MCRDIFKSSLNFYLKVENYDSLQSFLRQARIRWRAIFDRAVSQDAELAALVNKIDNRVGTLEIKGVPHPGRKMTIRDTAGKIIWFGSTVPGDNAGPPAANLPIGEQLQSFELQAGNYLLDITLPSGWRFRRRSRFRWRERVRSNFRSPTLFRQMSVIFPAAVFFTAAAPAGSGSAKACFRRF